MKLNISLVLNQIDSQSVKGDELDDELTSQLEGIELEGWEVGSVKIIRGKDDSVNKKEDIERLFIAMLAEVDNPDAPSKMNRDFSKRELHEWWLQNLQKLLK